METDLALLSLASRQHSLLTRDQLTDAGLTRRAIDERVRRGRLERVHRGIYRVAGSVRTFEPALAACLALGGCGPPRTDALRSCGGSTSALSQIWSSSRHCGRAAIGCPG